MASERTPKRNAPAHGPARPSGRRERARAGLSAWALAAAVALSALVGGAAGYAVSHRADRAAGGADVEAVVQRFIAENPQFILDTVNRHARDLAAAERRQAINLLKANDGLTVMGNPDGDVTVYEFSDYNCGYCKRVFADLMGLIEDDGNVRLVVKEYPILSEDSVTAAKYALAAAEMGKFEAFHQAAMAWPGRVDGTALRLILADLDIDEGALRDLLAGGRADAVIAENKGVAGQLRLTGTPAFVIGDAIVPGAIGRADLEGLVEQARGGRGNP